MNAAQQTYNEAFAAKCAEHGIDPAQLVKSAAPSRLANPEVFKAKLKSVRPSGFFRRAGERIKKHPGIAGGAAAAGLVGAGTAAAAANNRREKKAGENFATSEKGLALAEHARKHGGKWRYDDKGKIVKATWKEVFTRPGKGEKAASPQDCYAESFVAKCAEHGVDPQLLVKNADQMVNEILSGAVGNMVNPFAGLTNPIAAIHGMVHPGTAAEYRDKTPGRAFIPAAASHRMGQRQGLVTNESKRRGGEHPTGNLIAEQVGGLTSPVATVGAGAGVGAGMGELAARKLQRAHASAALGGIGGKSIAEVMRNARVGGVAAGAGAGMLTSGALTLVGLLRALINKRRTLDQQAKSETGGAIARKLLIPGSAEYGAFKRLGASRNMIEDKKRK